MAATGTTKKTTAKKTPAKKTATKKAAAPSARKSATPAKTSKPLTPTRVEKAPKADVQKPPAKRTSKRAAAAIDVVDRTAEVSQDVLESIESAQRAAIDAIRTFVDTIDDALPALGDRPSLREKVIDAALGMADSLVSTQYDFLRRLVRNVDDSLTAPRTGKG